MATLTEILEISGTLEKAEEIARQLVVQDPTYMLDLQLILSARGKVAESKKIIEDLSNKFPNDHRIAFNQGWHVLNEGDLQRGMELIDRGRNVGVFGSPALQTDKPLWDGKNAKGKTILLRCEGGLGDEILNIRFAKDIAERGGTVIVACDKGLQSVFSRVSGVAKTISLDHIQDEYFDAWVPAMSAVRVCGHTYETLPSEAYITALPEKIAEWNKTVNADNGVLKVGIRWSGNAEFEHEQMRRFPFKHILDVFETPNAKFFSLQRDSDLKVLPPEVVDLSGLMNTWEDTAGVIANLDLVITSCTSVAHMAAAMGKETWIIVPLMPYYTWAMPGNKTPWYKSVTLYRQESDTNWEASFIKVRQALEESTTQVIRTSIDPMQNHTKKTLHFVAGLPRSGSTMLISLLAQNPTIFGAPVSGLAGIVNGVNTNWDKIEFHKEVPNEEAKMYTLRAILDSYHAATSKPIILDKERHWIRYILLLEKLLDRKVKVIVPVRPIAEILTSFEVLRQKNPLTLTMVDEVLGPKSTLSTRCDYFMNEEGPVGSCINYTRDAVISGLSDRLLFVDYNKFIANPERDLKRIYSFLEIPYFEHDLHNIKQLTMSDDSIWKYPGLHDVRSVVSKISADPISVLGPELVAKFSQGEPWENWT
ncbi:MAG: sulfotransferase domain-containing protein [Patescibacteria group bacterium]